MIVSATAFDANDLLMTMLKDTLRLSSLLWLWLKLRLFPPNSDSSSAKGLHENVWEDDAIVKAFFLCFWT